MGMVLNRFGMLNELRESIRRNETEYLDYRQFRLTAVIVHHPDDDELQETFMKNFQQWSQMTGRHFLFLTFIPIPNPFSRRSHDYSFNAKSLVTDPSFTIEDEQQVSPLLRKYFGLPSTGSYLMLTEDICSSNFTCIPITAGSIQQQLEIITDYCESPEEHSPSQFQDLVSQLKGQADSLSKSFLDILLDITALTSQPTDRFSKQYQREHLKEWYAEGKNRLEQVPSEDLDNLRFQLIQTLTIGLSKISGLNSLSPETIDAIDPSRHRHQRHNSLRHRFDSIFDSEEYNYCNPEGSLQNLSKYSQTLYISYYLFKKFIDNKQASAFDYSGLTTYLGKILENELHLSICQMLRQVLGIPMPNYYNLYCPQAGNTEVNTGRGSVARFNRYQPGSEEGIRRPQESVPTGILLHAYQTIRDGIIDGFYNPQYFQEVSDDLINLCLNFNNNCRNPADHLDYNSRLTYAKAQQYFDKFIQEFLPELEQIRHSLEPRQSHVYRHGMME